jgi:hypothetical protein
LTLKEDYVLIGIFAERFLKIQPGENFRIIEYTELAKKINMPIYNKLAPIESCTITTQEIKFEKIIFNNRIYYLGYSKEADVLIIKTR